MYSSHGHTDVILPDVVNFLDQVFTELLMEKGLRRDCEAAEHLAKRLVYLYQSGVRDKDLLRNI